MIWSANAYRKHDGKNIPVTQNLREKRLKKAVREEKVCSVVDSSRAESDACSRRCGNLNRFKQSFIKAFHHTIVCRSQFQIEQDSAEAQFSIPQNTIILSAILSSLNALNGITFALPRPNIRDLDDNPSKSFAS